MLGGRSDVARYSAQPFYFAWSAAMPDGARELLDLHVLGERRVQRELLEHRGGLVDAPGRHDMRLRPRCGATVPEICTRT